MYKRFFILSLFSVTSLSVHGMELSGRSVLASYKLGNVKVRHNGMNYSVVHGDEETEVPNHSVDALLRKMKPEHLEKFQDCGYIKVNKSNDGHYSLDGRVRGEGGGPVAAYWAYMATKTFMYTTAAAAATATVGGAVVAAGGGVAAIAIGGAAAKAITVGAGTLAGASAVGSVGAAGVGAGTVAAIGVTNVAMAGGAIAAGAGSTAGAVAFVEMSSLAVGGLFAAMPWLP
jgi:hypothetical protein